MPVDLALSDHYDGTLKIVNGTNTYIKYGFMTLYCDQQMAGNRDLNVSRRAPSEVYFPPGEPHHCSEIEKIRTIKCLIDLANACMIVVVNQITVWVFRRLSWLQFKETFNKKNQYELR